MELEDQVCNLELAKRLKELGVKQDSFFFWEKCPDEQNNFIISNEDWHDGFTEEFTDGHALKSQEIYSAFSVAELGELLPLWCDVSRRKYTKRGWVCIVVDEKTGILHSCFDQKEADARALMIINLIENKVIEIK